MKVLLCSSFSKDFFYKMGGIDMWTKNIMDYYMNSAQNDVYLQLLPFQGPAIFESTPLYKRISIGISESVKSIANIYSTLRKDKFDVLHLSTSASLSLFKDYIIILLAHLFGCKTVVHFHFGRIPDLSRKKNWEFHMLNKIITISNYNVVMDMKSYETLLCGGHNNISYIPNPLPDSIIKTINQKCQVKKIPESCLFVGHGYVTKGVYELVRGCTKSKCSNLQIVGRFSDQIKNELIEIARRRDNGDWLQFVGEIPHDSVINQMIKADIFIFPSYTEGFPNVILEAMACRCAIISTGVGAIPEMLNFSGEPCGIQIEVQSEDDVKEKLNTLLDGKIDREDIREKAYERVHSLYSMQIVWGQLINVWEKVYVNV